MTVKQLMHILDPEGMLVRRRKRLRRRQYYNKGPNYYLWHIDGYEKVKPYGIYISGCIDGFSRKILWLRAAYTNNNPRIICSYFLDTVTNLKGYPQSERADMGTENGLIKNMQEYFHEAMHVRNGNLLPPFLNGTSQANQRIEAWWGLLRRQHNQYWMNCFQHLKDDRLFNGTLIDKLVLQYCFVDLIQADLNEFFQEWNNHVIRKTHNSNSLSGRPNIMYDFPALYGDSNFLNHIEENYIENCANQCVVIRRSCSDKTLFELWDIISREKNAGRPDSTYLAINNYCELRTEILNLVD